MENLCIVDIKTISLKDPIQNLNLQGGCSISGIVNKKGVKIPCRVRLYEKLTGLKVDEKLTDSNGKYQFSGLDPVEFFLVAHDPSSQYNAVIQDNVVPK